MGEFVKKPVRTRRVRWLARVATVIGCVVALGAGYAAAAGGIGSITLFNVGGGYDPQAIVAGPDGALWFSATKTSADSVIGRITPDGTVSKFTLTAGTPGAITEAPDGNLWFGDIYPTPSVGRITPDGIVTEFPVGTGILPDGIASDSQGNIWFTGLGRIGKVTPGGLVTTYTAGLPQSSQPEGIAAGADGAMWFVDRGTVAIGRITADGTITEYSTGHGLGMKPSHIARGADGNMWFLDYTSIGRITPSGQITDFAIPSFQNGGPQQIAAGADGNIWFTMAGSGGAMGEITPAGAITEFPIGTSDFIFPLALSTGSDGKLWITGEDSEVASFDVGAPPASSTPPEVTGSAQPDDPQSCSGALWSDWAGQQPSLNAFAEDGYQWLLDGSPIAGQTGPSYTPSASDLGHRLSCKVTATYTLFPATVSATSAAVTIIAPSTSSGGGGTGGVTGGGTGTTPPVTKTTTSSPPPPPPVQAPAGGTTAHAAAATLTVLRVEPVVLHAKPPKLHVIVRASQACNMVLVLRDSKGKAVATWKLHLARGTDKLALVLPQKARQKGRDTLRLQVGGGEAKVVPVTIRA